MTYVKPECERQPTKLSELLPGERFLVKDLWGAVVYKIKETSPTILDTLKQIGKEAERANELHGPLNSKHEGYAVLLEEVEEVWDEIKKDGSIEDLRKELIQVGAVVVKFLEFLESK